MGSRWAVVAGVAWISQRQGKGVMRHRGAGSQFDQTAEAGSHSSGSWPAAFLLHSRHAALLRADPILPSRHGHSKQSTVIVASHQNLAAEALLRGNEDHPHAVVVGQLPMPGAIAPICQSLLTDSVTVARLKQAALICGRPREHIFRHLTRPSSCLPTAAYY